MHRFTIIPEPIPVATPGDIDIRAYANISTFGTYFFGAEIRIPALTNTSTLEPILINTTETMVLPQILNLSTFGTILISSDLGDSDEDDSIAGSEITDH